ncbi:MAG: glycosyltransferase [Actinomycetota bacterium]
MRVLHVFKDYYPPTRGGIEQHIHDVVHSMPGFDSAVLTSSRSRKLVVEDDGGVRIIRTPELFRPASTPITAAWAKMLRGCSADLMHFHMPNPFGEMAYLASRSKVPMIATHHAPIVGRRALLPFFAPFHRRFLERASALVVGSERLLENSPLLGPVRDKTVVIPYGVDPKEWAVTPTLTETLKERYDGPIVLFLGRLAYYKGIDLLIEAMRDIQATCLIVGDGPLRKDLEDLTERLALSGKVRFVGEIPDEDRGAYYHAADVFVLPSTSEAETFGISMLEAMACGTPAISTEVGTGTSWLNQDDQTGLVVSPREPRALTDAIKTILGDKTRRHEMGHAAQARVQHQFTKAQMLESLASLYRSI